MQVIQKIRQNFKAGLRARLFSFAPIPAILHDTPDFMRDDERVILC
ncbi:Hypothetical protein BIBO2_2401 [Brucella sp. BO2]|nr:Hypothetical protein BIBO2_2401 [Brucella sp. BO2]